MQHEPNDRVNLQRDSIELTSQTPDSTTQISQGNESVTNEAIGAKGKEVGGNQEGGEIGGGGGLNLGRDQQQGEKETTRGTTESSSEDAGRATGSQEREKGSERTENENESGGVSSTSIHSSGTTTTTDRVDAQDSHKSVGTKESTPRKDEKATESIPTSNSNSITESSDDTASKTPPSTSLETTTTMPGSPSAKSELPSTSSSQTPPVSSVSPNPPTTTSSLPATTKRFSSSLSVNKKFLEKAGEKAHKPEPKPTTTRLSTPPIPSNPPSTSHPRLLTGKISTLNSTSSSTSTAASGSTIQLSTKPKLNTANSSTQSNSQQGGTGGGSSTTISWSKKPSSSSAGPNGTGSSSSNSNGSGPIGQKSSGGTGGAVWSTTPAAPSSKNFSSGPGFTTKFGSYNGIGLGRGGSGSGGFHLAAGDFPTAAEAAHAKEARARAVMEQMQARERALQARAAAAAAQNANLLQNLDAFRGVHLDPNAHHWDEDEDDFLDTTIEFGDGTQYKITEEDAAAAQQQQQQQEEAIRQARSNSQSRLGPSSAAAEDSESLREPSPSELARLETPLRPGEVAEPLKKSREERFGDDYDRSWPPKRPQQHPAAQTTTAQHPPRPSEKEDSNRNLFNDRLGKLEPAQHGHPNSSSFSGVGRRRMSSGADRGLQDLPPHLLDRRESGNKSSQPPRRPSITSRQHHDQAPPPSARNAWPRRPSNDLPAPSHGGRQLPPHLAAQATASAPPPSTRAPSSTNQPPAPASKVLSPTQSLAPLPETSAPPPPASSSTVNEPAPTTEADLEALHAREMHAAAERAKKRRQEEEQARLEQIERARKKAAELEEKMKLKSAEQKIDEKKVEEKAVEDKSVSEKGKEKSAENPWRTTAKPPAAPPGPSSAQPSTSILGRESSSTASTQPTSILTRPPQEKPSPAPPASQPSSTWRRPSNSAAPPPASSGTKPEQRQVPPHLAQTQQSQAEPSVSSAVTSPPPPPATDSSPSALPPTNVEKAISSPPITSPPTVPSSPSHERKSSAKSNPLGYKVPEVSQLDDLMSRIKGAMSVKETQKKEEKKVEIEGEANEDEEVGSIPTVKLPPPTPNAKLPRSRSSDLSSTSELRGKGRGRTETPRNVSKSTVPTFENRDPLLPFSGTRRARSPSPPPAWKAYAVKVPSRSPHKAPHYRNVSGFLSLHNPRPVHDVFSSNPLIHGINPRRLNRDDMLIPKKFVRGVPQCPVKIPSERIVRRSQEEEEALLKPSKPTPTVSISAKSTLVRAAVLEADSTEKEEETTRAESHDGSRGRGRGRTPDSGSWRRAEESTLSKEVDEVSPEQVEDAKPIESESTTETLPRGAVAGAAALKSKLPVGSSIGFYRSSGAPAVAETTKDRAGESGAKMFMVTSELNGEKIAATPREETTAPGADLAARSKMTPKSPPFKPKDVSSVLSSPSAAWTNKSLALSVLDPTASSVWSAAPVDSTAHARTISENQPENSLQGLVDDDPSVALPSSLAELKSEDEQSNEGKETSPTRRPIPSKDDAKLRAVAPSFSSFLHDSAAAIDTSSASSAIPPIPSFPPQPQQPSQHRPQSLAFSSYGSSHHSIPPQSTPSPVNPYSPSTAAYSPHLYGPSSQYSRAYGLSSASSISPFLSQPASHHQQHFPPLSPVTSSLGYPASAAAPSPNLYARPLPSASQSIPHGITNPALIANYNNGAYGQNVLNSAARYGAVGAGPRPNVAPTANSHSQQQSQASYYSHQQRSSYPSQQPQPNPSYHSQSSPYTTSSYLPNSSYRSSDPYHSHIPSASSYDYPQSQSSTYSRPAGGGGQSHGHGHSSSTTMPSPVIVPQHLPPPPPFFPQSQSAGSGANTMGGLGASVNGYGATSGGGAMRIGTNRFASGGNPGGRPW
ncbi:hypothetical protein JCM3765_001894 [Sporobolomyces pararoseus]